MHSQDTLPPLAGGGVQRRLVSRRRRCDAGERPSLADTIQAATTRTANQATMTRRTFQVNVTRKTYQLTMTQTTDQVTLTRTIIRGTATRILKALPRLAPLGEVDLNKRPCLG